MKFLIPLALSLMMGTVHAELVATFTQEGVTTDSRLDRLAALSIQAGQPVTPFLKPGKFDAEWTAGLKIDQRRRLVFSFEGKGAKAELSINGEVVLVESGSFGAVKSKRLRLNPGVHAMSVKYESAEDGAGEFRLYWEEDDMARQTIPPTAFEAIANDQALAGELKRRGRMVFAEQNCAKCHAPESGFGAQPMPEMGEIGPILAGLGDRVSEGWLREWIANPKALKPTTHMPSMIDPSSPEGLQQAADLAAFLIDSKLGGEQAATPSDPEIVKAGGVIFHELGCVSCHYPADRVGELDDSRRVPLNHVSSKYLPGQLEAYLKKPEAYHPFTAMPNFQLKDEEAKALAAFLDSAAKGKEPKSMYEFPKGDPKRGAALSESLQCGTCHPGLPGGVSKAVSLDGVFKVDWAEKGCVSEGDSRPSLPVPNLTAEDRKALIAFSKSGFESLKKDSPGEFAHRQIHAKRCIACHSIDDKVSLLGSLHGSTAPLAAHVNKLNDRVDQSLPQLTYIGEMLYTDYLESMLAGTVEERPRPWLGMRMPAFAAHAKPFAEGLSRHHGFEPGGSIALQTDPKLVEIGQTLIDADGLGCTTCHGVGDVKPSAAFEVGATHFGLVSRRLREGYYYRWMDHPAAVIPGNKMPRYAEGNQSPREDILGGDAAKQYEAIWHWIHEVRNDGK